MSHWNLRVIQEKRSEEDGGDEFSVREVFYNDDDSIFAYSESPVSVTAESVSDLREYVTWFLEAFEKPVLVDGEVEFGTVLY